MPHLTSADNNKTLDVGIGDAVTIELKGNPTTGYVWTRVGMEKLQDLTDRDVSVIRTFKAPGGGMLGAGGAYHFTICARTAGRHEVVLTYCRPFEAPNGGGEKFTVTLNASA